MEERWHRCFAGRSYAGRFVVRGGLPVERMGPATNILRAAVSDGRLRLDLVGFRLLGVPLPPFLRPRCPAVETGGDGAFTFDVPVSLPGPGQVIRYSGRLAPIGREGGMTMDDGGPVILFDAMCVLCSGDAQFVLRHDRHRRFSPRLHSGRGRSGTLPPPRHRPRPPDTMVVVTGDHALRDSDAVLAIYAGLGWPWRSASVLRLVPRFARNPLYRPVARNRYRLFGRRQVC